MDLKLNGGCEASQNFSHPPITKLKLLVNEYLSSEKINILGRSGKPIKKKRILAIMCVFTRAGYTMTFFDAQKFNDPILHTTVPTIEKDYGIIISRRWTKRRGAFEITDCKEYYLSESQLSAAEQLLFNRGA